MVVQVAVESVKSGVCVWETPEDIGVQGAIVIGVEMVDVGEGMEKSWNRSSVIGTEVWISNVTSGFVVAGSKTFSWDEALVPSSL